jgi:probable HAF family extracellular repeat protein
MPDRKTNLTKSKLPIYILEARSECPNTFKKVKMNRKQVLAAVIPLLSFSALVSALNAQIRYNVIDLGTLGGINDSHAYAVNNNGQIVGVSRNSRGYERATLFDPNGLGNNTDLGALYPSDFSNSCAYSISNGGVIVGVSEEYSAFFGSIYGWGNHQLGGSDPVHGAARSIADNGRIVGVMRDTPQSPWYAYIYFDEIGYAFSLGTLGGNYSDAYCINADTQHIQIVGIAADSSGHRRAALFNSVIRDGYNTKGIK